MYIACDKIQESYPNYQSYQLHGHGNMDILFRNFQNLPKLPKLPKLPVTCTSFSALTLQSYHKLPQLLKLPITLISLFPASTIQRSHPQWRKLPRLPVTSTFFFGKSFGTYRATTVHQLQNWPPGSATCSTCKFGYQVAPLALVQNLVTRWRYLHWLQV